MDEDAVVEQARAWTELRGARLGDARLIQRLILITHTLSKNPEESLPSAFAPDRDAVKAVYRFFDSDSVLPEAILAPRIDTTAQRDPHQVEPPRPPAQQPAQQGIGAPDDQPRQDDDGKGEAHDLRHINRLLTAPPAHRRTRRRARRRVRPPSELGAPAAQPLPLSYRMPSVPWRPRCGGARPGLAPPTAPCRPRPAGGAPGGVPPVAVAPAQRAVGT